MKTTMEISTWLFPSLLLLACLVTAASSAASRFAGTMIGLSSAQRGKQGALQWKISGSSFESLILIKKYVAEDEHSAVMFVKEGNKTGFDPAGLSPTQAQRFRMELNAKGGMTLTVSDVRVEDAGVYRAEMPAAPAGSRVALVAFKVDDPDQSTNGTILVGQSGDIPISGECSDSSLALFAVIAVLAIVIIVILVVLLLLTIKGVICRRTGVQKPLVTLEDGNGVRGEEIPLQNGPGPPKSSVLPLRKDGITVDLDLFIYQDDQPLRVEINQDNALNVQNKFGPQDQLTKWKRSCFMDTEERKDSGSLRFTLSEFLERSGLRSDDNCAKLFTECVNRDSYHRKLVEIPIRSLQAACAEYLYILVRSTDGSTEDTTKLQWSVLWFSYIQGSSCDEFTPTDELVEADYVLGFERKSLNVLGSIASEDLQNYFRYQALLTFYQDGLISGS